MFSVKGIEILGAPIGTDIFIKDYVQNNCLKIINDAVKHDPLTDGFVHFQLIKFCVNTRTQYMSANITLPPQEYFFSAQHTSMLTRSSWTQFLGKVLGAHSDNETRMVMT